MKNKFMKKKLILTGALLVAISLGIVGMSAFEAHVVNVTAKIENAMLVPQELGGLNFGTVFPEEVAYKNIDIQLSQSFLDEPRVDDVEYMIRQKPKCGVPVSNTNPQEYSSFPQVTEDAQGNFICPDGSVPLPLLCPYLSKYELDEAGATTTNGIAAFHGPLTGWTMTDTMAYQQIGRLSKQDGKISASWLIDLHAPCFKGECAQDNVVPLAYQADPKIEHQMFGCDLWVEVTNISLPPTSLTVIKHVINDNGGTKVATDFTMNVAGTGVSNPSFPGAESPGINVTLSPGSYTVTESSMPGYNAAQSADCVGTIAQGQHKTCVITNDDIGPTLTVNKVLDPGNDPGKFDLYIDDGIIVDNVGNGGTTGAVPLLAGAHSVKEEAHTGTDINNYSSVFSGACDSQGNVNLSVGDTKTCTITNTRKSTIKVTKIMVPSTDPGKFHLYIDNVLHALSVGNGGTTGAITVAPGVHNVSEAANNGTNLNDYISVVGGDCASDGDVTVNTGDTKNCTITNTRKNGTLTVKKVLIPASDTGKFNLTIDGVVKATDVGDGGTTGAVVVSPGAHNALEAAGTGTNLGNYNSVISGDCDAAGDVTVNPGDSKTCMITNTLMPGHLIVHKAVVNHVEGTTVTAADFQMTVDGNNVVQDASNVVTPGNHTVGENSSPNYTTTFSAECPGGVANVPAGGTVTCTVTNEQKFATLTLNKVVNNIHGGNHVAANFLLYASGDDATTQLTNGVAKNVAVGSLFINEQGVAGYQAVFTGDCDVSGQITLAAGDVKQCTITNTDLPPSITLVKVVDSGTASPLSFTLRIDTVFAPQSSSVGVTSNSAHIINEDAHTGYHFVSMSGTGSQGALCPTTLGGTVTLNEGENITCTIHNTINP
jgi:hypothetical protein